ncbi:oxaloacetate-decarboxylating malate dehydrogenase [Salmonella enterica]|uniref:oxaloacetate-decarboxylating malate dehydrogenase n=1 Tax=Salmonella enterica TaxID=28901 RepID=UPI002870A64D|nr:oxaloacetate-decarboxylating malate dehydrogenase [Salmonella enterica]
MDLISPCSHKAQKVCNNTGSVKWDFIERHFGDGAGKLLPMWVSDFDFACPPEVQAALHQRIEHGVFGYSERDEAYFNALLHWFSSRHQLTLKQEWVCSVEGVVPGLALLVQMLTHPGDGVVVQGPYYGSFAKIITLNGRKLLENPLSESPDEEQIIAQTQREGLSEDAARQNVFMVDRFGLLTDRMPNLLPFQAKLVQKCDNLQHWDTENDVLSLLDVVRNVKPDILIGVSGQTGLFTEEIIREMHKHCPRPIVMPLSNPTSRVEATPQDIIAWTEGNALVATGSPFSPVIWKDKVYPIAQCNNAYIFPGIGLGVIASGASRITDEMLMSASETLAKHSPLVNNGEGLVLPALKDIQVVSRAIAFAVGKMAQQQGVAVKTSAEALQQAIDDNFWKPEYRDYRRTSI